MSDTEDALERVRKYLAKRKEHEAFPNDTIVDLDEGSRGHTLLLESDIRQLVAYVEEEER